MTNVCKSFCLFLKVTPAIENIEGDMIKFADGQKGQFDAIVFATGFKSTVRKWLKVTRLCYNIFDAIVFATGFKSTIRK